jgi:hypothetical protein
MTASGRLYFQFNTATREDFAFLPASVAAMVRRLPGATVEKQGIPAIHT